MFFSGLTVLLGLLGLVLFEFMVLRSVGIAGAIVVGLAVAAATTLLPAILAIVGTRVDALAVRKVSVAAVGRRAVGPAGAPRDGPPGRRLRADAAASCSCSGSPFLHVRFNAPDATILPPWVPSREAYDVLAAEFGEGEFAPLRARGPDDRRRDRPGNVAALYDWSRRLAADPRVDPGRQLRRRRPAADARPVPAALRRAGGPAGPVRRDDPRRHDRAAT